MPSKRQLKQLKNAWFITAKQAKTQKIEVNTALQSDINNQLYNIDTSNISNMNNLKKANKTWFWNFSTNKLYSKLKKES